MPPEPTSLLQQRDGVTLLPPHISISRAHSRHPSRWTGPPIGRDQSPRHRSRMKRRPRRPSGGPATLRLTRCNYTRRPRSVAGTGGRTAVRRADGRGRDGRTAGGETVGRADGQGMGGGSCRTVGRAVTRTDGRADGRGMGGGSCRTVGRAVTRTGRTSGQTGGRTAGGYTGGGWGGGSGADGRTDGR